VRPHRDPAGPVLRAPKTAELIASYIRGQVVRGDLKTGDSLPSETVLLIDASDAEGPERHWRTHMEVVGRQLLPGDAGAKAVVDLFG
jgi:hypothetical protein